MYAQHEHSHCIETAVEAAERICEDRNLRFTELRRRVLELVWQNHGAAKAYDLLEQLGDDYSAKPPTVYRALDFLLENGLVHKINSLNAYVGCEHPLEHKDCFFLICSNCEEVAECCAGDVAKSLRDMVAKSGFKPTHTTLEIEGLCQQCQAG
ncbi:transcriptional repressor [Sneathiella sp. P13V-1]|uniref:transcriptional repressor n=1 Tax=Sneathiella sp. P13V-1 TaxID=2697366 RepID=UPI00187B595C|nr:transcriptional repressor [Sneathiella sp. P13V-1]MBE7636363.1 transcriptional repressor [Sneathiella sp. P13V-1]